jgi:hypothetical protein
MSLLNRLAGLPASLKDTWKKTFGDGDAAEDVVDHDVDLTPSGPVVPLEQAWGVVGVKPHATLDEVRAAARARAHGLQAGAARKDAEAIRALEQLAQASDLLEEHLLPALKGSAPSSSAAGSSSTASGPSSSGASSPGASSSAGPSASGRRRATPRG